MSNNSSKKIYLPNVMLKPPPVDEIIRRKGIGLPTNHVFVGDVDTLRCQWFYDWSCTQDFLDDPRYVPMSWAGSWRVNLPEDYSDYVLVLNEPDNEGQLNIGPLEAAKRVRAFSLRYPVAKMIVGGVSFFGTQWLQSFIGELDGWKPYGWHVHGYCEWGITPNNLMYWFSNARKICPDGEFWITEFADVSDSNFTDELLLLVNSSKWINRYAWFGNRLSGLEDYFPKHWTNPSLINSNEILTSFGKKYRNLL